MQPDAEGGRRRGQVKPAAPVTDSNEAEWLDAGHGDQVFEELGSVVDDSSLGLTLSDVEGAKTSAPTRRPEVKTRLSGDQRR